MNTAIELHTDFNVDLSREDEFLTAFNNFSRIVADAPGFLETHLMKLRPADAHGHGPNQHPAQIGETPLDLVYRLVQVWKSEEQRWQWNPTEAHHRAWAPLEQPLKKGASGLLFTALLFDRAE
jgi:heme-degrading monooxygenase HmoA